MEHTNMEIGQCRRNSVHNDHLCHKGIQSMTTPGHDVELGIQFGISRKDCSRRWSWYESNQLGTETKYSSILFLIYFDGDWAHMGMFLVLWHQILMTLPDKENIGWIFNYLMPCEIYHIIFLCTDGLYSYTSFLQMGLTMYNFLLQMGLTTYTFFLKLSFTSYSSFLQMGFVFCLQFVFCPTLLYTWYNGQVYLA